MNLLVTAFTAMPSKVKWKNKVVFLKKLFGPNLEKCKISVSVFFFLLSLVKCES